MKVVLFCGGMGMRLREYSDAVPKPMVPVGYRPILWHVMKYYAHYGHKDFCLCLGYKADVIKRYFLDYDECLTNDFVLSKGASDVELLRTDIHDWKITFIDTGLRSNIGTRLALVRDFVADEEIFLANYSDGVTDMNLSEVVDKFKRSGKAACFVGVKPRGSFHMISSNDEGVVQGIQHVQKTDTRVNGGYFIFTQEVFDYMQEGEELVEEPFRRMIADGQLMVHNHDGFWGCMDTFKEKQDLDDDFESGEAPWEIWR